MQFSLPLLLTLACWAHAVLVVRARKQSASRLTIDNATLTFTFKGEEKSLTRDFCMQISRLSYCAIGVSLFASHILWPNKGNRVFLSGANQPWIDYGNDFGNNQTNAKVCELREYIANVSKAGGNTMRIWLFIEGDSIPAFDSDGMVTGTDKAGSLIEELRAYAEYAASMNVFINLVTHSSSA